MNDYLFDINIATDDSVFSKDVKEVITAEDVEKAEEKLKKDLAHRHYYLQAISDVKKL